jgi:hypothetical protein
VDGESSQTFRSKQKDTSVAHVLKQFGWQRHWHLYVIYPKAGLEELNEATLSILCNGEPVMMSLLQDELI